MKTYLYEYHYQNSRFMLELPADSQEEADERVAVISSRSKYVGELSMKIPAAMGWFARLYCGLRNWLQALRAYAADEEPT